MVCYLRARHWPCRNNSFSKQHVLVGVPFLDPEDRNVNRTRHVQMPALQRSAMCIAHHHITLIFRSATGFEKVLLESTPLSLSE